MMITVDVTAMLDGEAKVWVAWSDGVPGLACESDSLDRLFDRLREMIPELLMENRGIKGPIFVRLHTTDVEHELGQPA